MSSIETTEVPAVSYEVSDVVAVLTLQRPEARNVLTPGVLDGLLDGVARATADDAVRVLLLRATGTTFCGGADLASAGGGEEGPRRYAQVLAALQDSPKPTIARVQGHVAGGGNGLVAACDLSVAVGSARFAFTEVRVGAAPAVVAVACLPRLRPVDAAELFLTGERIDAWRARQVGLVTRVVDDVVALDDEVAELVDALRHGGPGALATTKALLRRLPGMPREDAFAWAAQVSAGLFASEEAREGMTAFLQKRSASWAPRRA
ncbi:MAG: enoyl-CoA hydratase-related protein [Motilibacteraceae bacterium]